MENRKAELLLKWKFLIDLVYCFSQCCESYNSDSNIWYRNWKVLQKWHTLPEVFSFLPTMCKGDIFEAWDNESNTICPPYHLPGLFLPKIPKTSILFLGLAEDEKQRKMKWKYWLNSTCFYYIFSPLKLIILAWEGKEKLIKYSVNLYLMSSFA